MPYRAYYEDVFAVAQEVVGPEFLDSQLRTDENTFWHQVATGAMMTEVLALHDFDSVIGRLGAAAGAFHDIGKYHPEIQELMASGEGRVFSNDERALMATHVQKGHDRILSLDCDPAPELTVAAFAALHHHDQFTPDSYRTYGGMTGLAHLVQLCDIGHARLFDRSRTYSTARDGGRLTPAVIGRQMLEQFVSFPPIILGSTIRVEEVIDRWQHEAQAEY